MSINNIYIKYKKYWAISLAAIVFLILGILTVYGIAAWYIALPKLSLFKLILLSIG